MKKLGILAAVVSVVGIAFWCSAVDVPEVDNDIEHWGSVAIRSNGDVVAGGNLTVYGTVSSSGSVSQALASNKFLVGNASGEGAAVTLSGDIATTLSGVVTIQPASVGVGDLAVSSNQIVVGNAGGTGTAVTVSGDVTMDVTGAFSGAGFTTNFAVLVPGGTTNYLSFTNGLLRAVY
jgi:hypothetical protein